MARRLKARNIITLISTIILLLGISSIAVFSSIPTIDATTEEEKNGDDGDCDPSYPDTCIPSPPPNLNCKDISEKRFKVEPPDPHGIGCES